MKHVRFIVIIILSRNLNLADGLFSLLTVVLLHFLQHTAIIIVLQITSNETHIIDNNLLFVAFRREVGPQLE
jgi:hypothetical protein